MRIARSQLPTAIAAATLAATPALAQVEFEWALIANAPNFTDPATGFGLVDSPFLIATHEVTNAQYAEFLNSAAQSDPNQLYNTQMFTDITRSGVSGSYTYAPVPGLEHKPVVFIDRFRAMRFVNWMHNGQGDGDTESGVYDIADGLTETRATDALFFIPTEDEWYKAAYHQPITQGGDDDEFWLYPTSSNDAPVPGVDANFGGAAGGRTDVGSYPPNFYGVHDMAGNVWEWTESLITPTTCVIRGGFFGGPESLVRATTRGVGGITPSTFGTGIGFRIASPAPDCPGDVNGDYTVDFSDLNILIATFGAGGPDLPADLDGDMFVGFSDLNEVLASFGSSCF